LRALAKRLLFYASAACTTPLYALYRVSSWFTNLETAFQLPSQMLSLVPGTPGTHLRAGFYAMALRRCAPECAIGFGTIFSTPECEIGSHVYIGAYCVISDSVIGRDTLLGSHVHIVSGKHAHGFELSDTPMRLQKTSRQPIAIGENTWIGNGAIVMADVGTGCVVGAGSVVTRPVADNSIVAGNPARLVRARSTEVAAAVREA
jgi:acetyltransferase-like isoleucine patch superfamily enzyme